MKKLVVATTRLETMFRDDNKYVQNPEDPRYKHLHWKVFDPPFHSRRILYIITDAELVDMEFGTAVEDYAWVHDPKWS
jgi:valyl-tRNA synthetase